MGIFCFYSFWVPLYTPLEGSLAARDFFAPEVMADQEHLKNKLWHEDALTVPAFPPLERLYTPPSYYPKATFFSSYAVDLSYVR